ncbi:MAG TPA: hypothetical protein DCM28_16570 [Phycisphaerales bacterium]|nr:hypothetical protein [Phycisphaerales bacterium]HCD34995.1 hypothetical protein [Phycisphaerales bacterium]|tara:strand:+ start:2156 stop:3019 length:864 start_codon:yes stop_codon:yes gene_type:complete
MKTQKLLRIGTGAHIHAHVEELNFDNITDAVLDEARALVEDGYDDLELTIAHFEPWMKQLGNNYWQELGQAIREIGIEPISVHGPYYPLLDTDRAEGIAMLSRHAKAASAMKVKAMVIHPVYHKLLHVTPIMKQAMQWDVDLSLAISDVLGDSGTLLAIENVPFNSFAYLQALLEQLDRTNIGMCFDTGHYHVRPEHSIEKIIDTFGNRIVHLHLSDNNGLSDQHLPIGQGTFDWKRFFACFDPQQINNHLMVELSAPLKCDDPNANAVTRRINKEALDGLQAVFND